MIRVDRSLASEPASLHSAFRSDDLTELERVRAFRLANNGSAKGFEYGRYKSADVKTALDFLFHGKCAYCESPYDTTQPVDVEHYRPKGSVEDSEHAGYWWLAMDWANLLPSCIDCNRRRKQKVLDLPDTPDLPTADAAARLRTVEFNTGKKDAFPLQDEGTRMVDEGDPSLLDNEARLLLDPTRDDPDKHLIFDTIDGTENGDGWVSWVRPVPGETPGSVSSVGTMSIKVYGLNRMGLVQARSRLLLELEFLLNVSVRMHETIADLGERAAGWQTRIDALAANDPNRALLEADLAFDAQLTDRLVVLRQRIEAQIRNLAKPEAPYSAAVRAWIKQMADKLKQA